MQVQLVIPASISNHIKLEDNNNISSSISSNTNTSTSRISKYIKKLDLTHRNLKPPVNELISRKNLQPLLAAIHSLVMAIHINMEVIVMEDMEVMVDMDIPMETEDMATLMEM
mmetsp:Transcript_15390/g.17748  ORF Transcript_15390/g.17748 Transcript_15390/m.17748 type:complete len:113 (+) Transcript_15390:209-547(+)